MEKALEILKALDEEFLSKFYNISLTNSEICLQGNLTQSLKETIEGLGGNFSLMENGYLKSVITSEEGISLKFILTYP